MLVEGGGELNAGFLRERSFAPVNRVHLYVAPALLGGQKTKGLLGWPLTSTFGRSRPGVLVLILPIFLFQKL